MQQSQSDELAVELRAAPYDPDSPDRTVRYKGGDTERPLYRVFLYLDGHDLSWVRRVTYTLHPTFPDPVRTVERSLANPRCKLEIWTWGLFRVTAVIEDSRSRTYSRYLDLAYDRQFGGAAFEKV